MAGIQEALVSEFRSHTPSAPTQHSKLSAVAAGPSRGRAHLEADCTFRNAYQRDRDRIVHAKAFRRLTHKTQVFLFDEGDHYRNRLTHSLEVAQIARSLARILSVDEDLAEAIALAHDLGHTPFGHAGERGLSRAMTPYGGFDHNAQSLRVVTELEQHYARFDGLNLSFETLEGLAKHNGPLAPDSNASGYVASFDLQFPLDLHLQPSLEAQIAALADDIAYNNHDLDDGLRAGLFSLPELATVPLVWRIIQDITVEHPGLEQHRLVYELNRRLITTLITDVVEETEQRLVAHNIQHGGDVAVAPRALAGFSKAMTGKLSDLKRFLFRTVYRHENVMLVMASAESLVERLAGCYMETPDALPAHWHKRLAACDDADRAVGVIDFIAGMTDRYAVEEYRRLFAEDPGLRQAKLTF